MENTREEIATQLYPKLGKWLADQLDRKGMSMRSAALYVGVSHGTLARTRLGLAPDINTLRKLAEWGKVSLAYLLGLMDIPLWEESTDRTAAVLLESNPVLREIVLSVAQLAPETQREIEAFVKFKGAHQHS